MHMGPPPPAPNAARPEEPTMATLAQMMQHMMSINATRNDIDGVQSNIACLGEKVPCLDTQVKAVATKVTQIDVKVQNVEKRIGDIDEWKESMQTDVMKVKEEAIDAAKQAAAAAAPATTASARRASRPRGRRSTGTTTSRSGGAAAEWRARVVHIHGFAPYGSSGKKSTRERTLEEQRKITSFMDEHFPVETRVPQPFVQNHSISLEVLAAESWTAKHWADKLNMTFTSIKYKIDGSDIEQRWRQVLHADKYCEFSSTTATTPSL